MSQLLDALRRAGRSGPAREKVPPGPTRPGAILATLGQGAKPRRRTGLWLALLAVSSAAVIIFAWSGLRPGRTPVQSRIADQAAVSPRQGGPPKQAPPAAAPTATDARKATAIEATQKPPAPAAQPRPAPRPTADDSGSRAFARALALQQGGDLAAALAAYRTLFTVPSFAAAARNNAGLIHQQRGELAEAQRAFELALENWPSYARAHNNLGVVLLAIGQVGTAAEHFKRAAELDPRDADARINLALTYKSEGRLEQAKEALLQALVLSPSSAPAHYNLAVVYDHSGEPGRAIDHYRSFLEHSGAEYAARAADVRARIDALDRTR